MPYLLTHGLYHWFNILNIFIWITSLTVVALGLNQYTEVFGKAIDTFVLIRNPVEFFAQMYLTYYHFGNFRAYHFILFGIWYHRIIDTYLRFYYHKYTFISFPLVLMSYALCLYIGYTQTLIAEPLV
jgi:hypothetical protein